MIKFFPDFGDVFAAGVSPELQQALIPLVSFTAVVDGQESTFHMVLPDPRLIPLLAQGKPELYGATWFEKQGNTYVLPASTDELVAAVRQPDEYFTGYLENYLEGKAEYTESFHEELLGDLSITAEPEWWQEDDTPSNAQGEPMTFVASLYTEGVITNLDAMVYLFYSPTDGSVAQVYQIS